MTGEIFCRTDRPVRTAFFGCDVLLLGKNGHTHNIYNIISYKNIKIKCGDQKTQIE